MFRTMQTSSAACALYALGALAGAAAWPWTLWASGAPRSALQGLGWSPACRPSPRARDCPSLAVGSSWCWTGDAVCEKGLGTLHPFPTACRLSPFTTAWGPAAAPVSSTTLQPEPDAPAAGMARLGLGPTRAVAKLQTQPHRAPTGSRSPQGSLLGLRSIAEAAPLRGVPRPRCVWGRSGFLWSGASSPRHARAAALTLLFLFSRGGAGSNRGFQRRELLALAVRGRAAQP